MNSSYRFIHLVVDRFQGTRFPLGALVSDGVALKVVPAKHIPSGECAGSYAPLAKFLIDRLYEVTDFHRLPGVFGPHVKLDEPKETKESIHVVSDWLSQLFEKTKEPTNRKVTSKSIRRSTYGMKFFDTWGVSSFVQKRFDPETHWGGGLAFAKGLKSITHWVGNAEKILLMEPILPRSPTLEKDLVDVATRGSAYRYAFRQLSKKEGAFYAYVLRGGSEQIDDRVSDRLRPHVDSVVFTEQKVARESFIKSINELGQGNSLTFN